MKCLANGRSAAKLIKERADANIQVTARLCIASTAMVLLDKHGFNLTELRQTLDQITEVYDSIVQGYVTFDDILKTLNDEYGLDLRFTEGKK